MAGSCLGAKARILILTLISLTLSAPAFAWTVTVAWDPNPAQEDVTGYILHYGTTPRTGSGFSGYDQHVDVGNVTEHSVDFPDAATYYVAVTAYNAAGLGSDYSAEISADPPLRALIASSQRWRVPVRSARAAR